MNNNHLALTPGGNWRTGNEYGSSSPDQEPYRRRQSGIPRPLYYGSDEGGGMFSPWRLFEERVRTGPFGLNRFPSQPHSPVRILILDGGMEDRVNPRLRQFIQDSPPRIRGEWHLPVAHEREEPGLTTEELSKVMKKLKKQVYNPPSLRKKSRKKGLFSNWRSSNTSNKQSNTPIKAEEEEGKSCAICLESFVANEQVLVTPCNHMFHNNCLVPWVKSHGQCPVCRLEFCERREVVRSFNGGNFGYALEDVGDDELAAADLISLIRAMEEAFNWAVISR